MVKIILMSQLSHNFTHVKRQTSTFYIIPAFSAALNLSSNYSITWQKSWYFPWDNMSYYPLTTLNSNHAPPHHSLPSPSVCLQHSSSLQIKPHWHSPFSLFPPSTLPGKVKGYCSFILKFFNIHLCLTLPLNFTLCLQLIMIIVSYKRSRQEGRMNGLNRQMSQCAVLGQCNTVLWLYKPA